MSHGTYLRIIPEADTAVLFIHGIMGTPNHFVTQIPLVESVPKEWSVCNVLLDGHGSDVDHFSGTSMRKWKKQVFDAFRMLCESHRRVIIAGHSMGTLFAIQMALERPDKVPFLFLLATPLRPYLSLRIVMNSMRLVFNRIRGDRPEEVAIRNACGVRTTRKLWKYIGSLPRFLELFLEIIRTEKNLDKLTVPCISCQSARDELVLRGSCKVLERSGTVEVHCLQDSSHFYYAPEDREAVRNRFISCCKEITHD